ncbi:MAG: hypothetical protein ACRCXC_08900 [Legionella sp.]
MVAEKTTGVEKWLEKNHPELIKKSVPPSGAIDRKGKQKQKEVETDNPSLDTIPVVTAAAKKQESVVAKEQPAKKTSDENGKQTTPVVSKTSTISAKIAAVVSKTNAIPPKTSVASKTDTTSSKNVGAAPTKEVSPSKSDAMESRKAEKRAATNTSQKTTPKNPQESSIANLFTKVLDITKQVVNSASTSFFKTVLRPTDKQALTWAQVVHGRSDETPTMQTTEPTQTVIVRQVNH